MQYTGLYASEQNFVNKEEEVQLSFISLIACIFSLTYCNINLFRVRRRRVKARPVHIHPTTHTVSKKEGWSKLWCRKIHSLSDFRQSKLLSQCRHNTIIATVTRCLPSCSRCGNNQWCWSCSNYPPCTRRS